MYNCAICKLQRELATAKRLLAEELQRHFQTREAAKRMTEKALLEARIDELVDVKKSMIEAFDVGAIESKIRILTDKLAELNKGAVT